MRKSLNPEALTDVTHDWLVKQQDAESHKGGWLVGDCWMDRESVRAHAETCPTCRDIAYAATQWRAEPGQQYTSVEPHGETTVDAQEFLLLPPEESDEQKRIVLVDYNREMLWVDERWLDDDDPMADVYWAAINAAGA